jgi:hypothetical protein
MGNGTHAADEGIRGDAEGAAAVRLGCAGREEYSELYVIFLGELGYCVLTASRIRELHHRT